MHVDVFDFEVGRGFQFVFDYLLYFVSNVSHAFGKPDFDVYVYVNQIRIIDLD